MSYHRTGLGLPAFSSTQAFAQTVDPYATRMSPPHSVYSPYGWGPDFNVGMPMNYTHHLDYVRDPAAIAIPRRRPVGVRGPMYDRVAPYLGIFSRGGPVDGDAQQLAGLGGILAAM